MALRVNFGHNEARLASGPVIVFCRNRKGKGNFGMLDIQERKQN